MNKEGTGKEGSLMLRFFGLYSLSLFAGISFIMFTNLYGLQIRLEEMLYTTIPFLLVSVLLFVLMLLVFTRYRLRKIIAYANGRKSNVSGEEAFRRLLRFPVDIFWAIMGISVFFTIAFHVFDYGAEGFGHLLRSSEERWSLLTTVLHELSLALMLAVLLYTSSRTSLRPFLMRLNAVKLPDMPGKSFQRTLLLTFFSCMLLTILSLLQTIADKTFSGEPLDFNQLVVVAGVSFVFGLGSLLLPLLQFRREVRLLTGRLFALQGEKRGVSRKIPIVSLDESGRLAEAFNELQAFTETAYEDLTKELRLAASVQQKLLPPPLQGDGTFLCSALCEQSLETGGDFYDWMKLDERRLAVLVGDVIGKGMPAALIMSAVLALFRLEVRSGGTPGEVLSRLNRRIVETLQGEMLVTAGLAFIELDIGRLHYASAGHLAPYVVSGSGEVKELPVSSMPLGVDEEERYLHEEYELAAGDRLIMYSDGVVESLHADGTIYGFDEWERRLSETDGSKPPAEQLSELMAKLPHGAGSEPEDDRTIVCVRWTGGAVD